MASDDDGGRRAAAPKPKPKPKAVPRREAKSAAMARTKRSINQDSDESGDEASEEDGDGAAGEWLETGHTWLGALVRRFFMTESDVTFSDGEITRWLPAGGGEAALWHMVHEDGDEEDLEAAEVRAAMRAHDEEREVPPEEGEDEGEDSVDDEAEAGTAGGEAEVELVISRRYTETSTLASKRVEYLVKWKGQSYLHVGWRTELQLTRVNPKVSACMLAFTRACKLAGARACVRAERISGRGCPLVTLTDHPPPQELQPDGASAAAAAGRRGRRRGADRGARAEARRSGGRGGGRI